MRTARLRQTDSPPLAATWAVAVGLGLIVAILSCPPVKAAGFVPVQAGESSSLPPAASNEAPTAASHFGRADFHGIVAPQAVQKMADWVVDSANNQGLPFIIVYKPGAHVFVFGKDGRLAGTAWVLVGLASGDDSVPGIGTMPLASITPNMRTTPAGRFVSTLGHDLGKLDVLWVDYPDAISLHRVINTDPTERRLERIVSPEPLEHRISYGCINVPAHFFDTVVEPAFKKTSGVVYILPEVKLMRDVFPGFYDVNSGATASAVAVPVLATK